MKPVGIDRRQAVLSGAILFLGLAVLYVAMVSWIQPLTYDIKVGEVAPQTITATKDVVDEITTQRRRSAERDAVQPIEHRDQDKAALAGDKLAVYFAQIDVSRQIFKDYRAAQMQIPPGDGSSATSSEISPRQIELDRLRQALDPASASLSDDQLASALTATEAEYAALQGAVTRLVTQTMEEGLRESDLSLRLRDLRNTLAGDFTVPEVLRALGNNLMIHVIEPNVFPDEEATERARAAAADAVETVVFKMGQNIVLGGEPVQENQLYMLEMLGLIRESARIDMGLYIGMGLLTLLLGAFLAMYFLYTDPQVFTPKRALLLVSVILLLLVSLLALRQINAYLMPTYFAVMMIAILFSPRTAIGLILPMSFLAGVLASGEEGIFSAAMLEMLVVAQIGGLVAALSLRRVQRRISLLLSGIWTGLAAAAAMVGIGLITNLRLEATLLHAGYAALGGLISAVLMVGFLPVYEAVFGMLTQQKLLELSNPNQPLLRKLQLEAPGTYHHSLLVANLAEAAAEMVGANGLLCRVGAYYHDVGKTKRPMFFKENQLDGTNPHDDMDPQVSAAILAAHVRDGRQLAEKAKLPRSIVDIIAQHHGTSSMAYFYYKAQKAAEVTGEEVSAEDYRYDGPTPQSKEAAIISLADSVEAAVRSLKDHSTESMQAMVKKLVHDRLMDGQLMDVDLTLSDFNKIEEAFMHSLGGVYHMRVEYPEIAVKGSGTA